MTTELRFCKFHDKKYMMTNLNKERSYVLEMARNCPDCIWERNVIKPDAGIPSRLSLSEIIAEAKRRKENKEIEEWNNEPPMHGGD